jgi:ribonuclease BN (tRNA processing enzyme)
MAEMEIRILGAHNVESAETRLTSLLVDDVLAVDAGALTSSLSFAEQEKVNSILLTHCHYDHVRDVAAMALNFSYIRKTVNVYSQASTLDAILNNVLNDVIYPNFTKRPTASPSLKFHQLELYKATNIDGYTVLALPVKHAAPAVGYQIASKDGRSFFFSGDTGPGLSSCWEHIAPQLLIIDLTMPNELEEHAIPAGHLTPRLLGEELAQFKKVKGYLPPVVVIHVATMFENQIREQTAELAKEIGTKVTIGHEGMKIKL